MGQKLSAMTYIRNNKRRVAVLVVSLGLCLVLTYLTDFLLTSTEETFKVVTVDNAREVQYIFLAGSSLGIDVKNFSDEEINREYEERNLKLAENLEKYEEVKEAFFVQVLYNNIAAAVGEWGQSIPLVEREQVEVFMEHYGLKLADGRMPENQGEIIMDKAAMSNGDYKLNDYFKSESYDNAYKIVGIIDSERYLGFGIPSEKVTLQKNIVVLSDGSINDITKLLEKEGIYIRDTYDWVVDVNQGKIDLKKNVTDVLKTSTDIIYIVITILLFLALFIVYTMYLRDRHNEWCLYCSIGYSRKEIYLSIMRELLFTFGVAIIIGIILVSGAVVLTDYIMLKPAGIKCRYFYPNTLGEVLSSFVLLLGMLQLPVRYALHRIKTIDAMDDDLY